MKTALKIILLVVFLNLLGLDSFSQEKEVPKATEKENTFIVNVDFHCGHGKYRLEKNLVKLEGVKKVNADLKTKNVTVEHDSEIIQTKEIVNAIEKIGHRTEYTPKNKKIESACSH